MDSIGEKGYLMRRNFINNECLKRLSKIKKKKLNIHISNNNNSNNNISNNKYETIEKEQEKFEKFIREKKIDLDKELNKIKINLKKRLLNKSNKKKELKQIYNLNTERTKDLSLSSLYNNSNLNTINILNNTSNNIKEKKELKLNLSLKIIKPKFPYTKTLSELNKLTDELGITNKLERNNYIYDKEKRNIYENNSQRDLNNLVRNSNRRLTFFSSTSKLNNYLIKEFNLNENNSESIKKKIEISELTFEKIKQLRKKNVYSQSQKSLITDFERDNFYYNLYNNEKSYFKKHYSEKEMKKIKREYYKNKYKEKLKKNEKIFEKIKNLNFNVFSEVISNHKKEYKNLDRMIKIKRYKKKIFFDDMKLKKEKLQKNNDEVYITLSKFQPSVLFNKHFKVSTINQFKSVNGIYFGLPV
jgi:hypothetical protein